MQFENVREGHGSQPPRMIFEADSAYLFQGLTVVRGNFKPVLGNEVEIPINKEDEIPLREALIAKDWVKALPIIQKHVTTQQIRSGAPNIQTHEIPEGTLINVGTGKRKKSRLVPVVGLLSEVPIPRTRKK